MDLTDIEKSLGMQLPNAYKKLVAQIDDFRYVSFNEFPLEHENDEGVPWFFWGEARLFVLVHMEGARSRPAWQQLASFAEIDRNHRGRKAIPCGDGRTRAFAHLETSVAMAEDNGDILYLDVLDGFSVWVYLHASGEVKKIAESFGQWLEVSRMDD